MATYKLQKGGADGIVRSVLLAEENASIPFDPANTDYQAYLKWLEEGNTPEPADDPTAE